MKFVRSGFQTTLSDEQLLGKFKQEGDKTVLPVLFERYIHLVFGVCMKYLQKEDESKDLSMEIFEKLENKLLKFEILNFKSWLYRVVKNECLMKLRHEQSVRRQTNRFKKEETPVVEYFPEEHPEKEVHFETEQIQEAISKLNAEQRLCIELFYLKEKSYKEISDSTGLSLLNVKSYIQNGKRNLKLILTNKN